MFREFCKEKGYPINSGKAIQEFMKLWDTLYYGVG
jgi:hypothetical protein